MNGTMEYYNKTAAEWAEKGYSGDYEALCLPHFLSMLKPGARVLDLGCGCGYDCERLKKRGFVPIGIDFSEESLKIAKSRNPKTEFICADMLSDYSRIGQVDAVMAIASLVHIENQNLRKAFKQMDKVLAAGGLALFAIRYGSGKIEELSRLSADGESLDRNFIAHNLEEIVSASKDFFEYISELETDMPIWEFHLFRKKCG